MRSESNVRPEPVTMERHGNDAEVIFCVNIQAEQRENGLFYTYDEYRLIRPYRDNLIDSVHQRFDEWVELARRTEQEAQVKLPTVEERLRQLQDTNAALLVQNQELSQIVDILLGGDNDGQTI